MLSVGELDVMNPSARDERVIDGSGDPHMGVDVDECLGRREGLIS